MLKMDWFFSFLSLLLTIIHGTQPELYRPCSEISRELRFPCLCSLGAAEDGLNGNPAISVNCDRVVFPGDLPSLPYGAPIVSFSQRWVGHQALPTQVFSSTGLPLRNIDLSGNSLRRLTDRLLQGLQTTLLELRLSDNLLGDTLNPIFSSSEFHGLIHLQLLDLSGNGIKAIEEGILEGCNELKELYLDRNTLTSIPTLSLNGPKSLRFLSLKGNRIDSIKTDAFQAQLKLEHIDLSHNMISAIEGGALSGLDNLKLLNLGHNRLSRFNSDVFQGAENLNYLDLSENFILEFPSVAFTTLSNLRYLNLSSNLIQSLDNKNLGSLTNLFQLDVSRNNIAYIVPGTFLGLKQLRRIDISVNSLRQIEDDSFEGLDNLEHLNLKDNNILLIPASALGRLPKLTSLQLDYNRITALSGDILRSIADRVSNLVLSNNVVRELPSGSFQYFHQLENLDLSSNLITTLNFDAFTGLETTLIDLKLSQNRISNLIGSSITLLRLKSLDLSENDINEITPNGFINAPFLQSLNLSHNYNLTMKSSDVINRFSRLEICDLRFTNLKSLTSKLFLKTGTLKTIYLSYNGLSEIVEGTFSNLPNLTEIDLSYNKIGNIRQGSFVNVMNIKVLNLKGNQLNSFKGEFFNTGTSLEILDISNNQLSYLFPSSFRIHPRLKQIFAGNNKFSFFPAELVATLQYLELVDLSRNNLKTIEELDFARLPRLRSLFLNSNRLESISEMAFHNSTQLQNLDLSHNKIDRLGERTFEGLVRLENLNLEDNELTDLPETIFERARLQMLENINLARNLFEVAPLKALQKQYFFVSSVDLSYNKLKEIPGDDSIMVNIKKLDLSFNDLSENAIMNVLSEPKTVRELNLAGTGIKTITHLETPFLNHLNLSHNYITTISENAFERTTLLETLDLSHNKIKNLNHYSKIWSLLRNLQTLNISNNPIEAITQNDFEGLESLKHLSLQSLTDCSKLEKSAFKFVPNLSELNAYDYPKLGYLDVKGLLQNIPSLERVNIETKDAAIGSEQLISVLHPRLKQLGIRGPRLRSISSGTLSGVKGSEVEIALKNTSLTFLPPALFFSIPRSSKITLDVTGSQLTKLTPQILIILKDRRGYLKLTGLESNPIICDCGARALRRWIPTHMENITCSGPEHLSGKLLVEIPDDDLTCDLRKLSTITTMQPTTAEKKLLIKTAEPEIIWSVPATTEKVKNKPKIAGNSQAIGNDDTLIIGIVGGVVAFIAILIIVICIIRLKMSGNQYRGGATVMGPVVGAPGSNCACSVKGAPSIYAVPPAYAPGYAATLPHKLQTMSGGRPSNYSTMSRVPYYQSNSQPYFISYPPTDEKIYR